MRRACRACSPIPAPGSQLAAFAPDGMDLTLSFWIRDPENGQGNVKSDVNLAVLDVLNARAASEIPFPQRVVHAVVSTGNGAIRRTGASPRPARRCRAGSVSRRARQPRRCGRARGCRLRSTP